MTSSNNTKWMQEVSSCLAHIYHHAAGSDTGQQQAFALMEMQKLFMYGAAYWFQCTRTGEKLDTISYRLDANTRRRLDRAVNNKKLLMLLNTDFESVHSDVKSDRLSLIFQTAIDKVKGLSGGKYCMVKVVENRVHVLLLLDIRQKEYSADSLGADFVFERVLHSLKIRDRMQYKNNRIRPNSYKAICNSDLHILEAEENFNKLIRELSPEVIQDNKFVGKLKTRLLDNANFTYKEIVYSVTSDRNHLLVEIYFDDPRMRNMTGKKLDVIKLIYLEREEMAKRLNMKLKSLDAHLGVIYDEFGTREKKKILAATHYFPDFSKRKRLSL